MFAGIVPQPQSIVPEKGEVRVSGMTFRCDERIDDKTFNMIGRFAGKLSYCTAKMSPVSRTFGLKESYLAGKTKGFIFVNDASLASEEYQLKITPGTIAVCASDYNGFLYAIQTIRQMLPVAIYGNQQAPKENWKLPCCTISDKPRFAHRGVLLDCARYYEDLPTIKSVLDIMSVYKMNRFHWHITEDQGWRIEIKKYPLLTEKGSVRPGTQRSHDFSVNDGKPYGGFYTQEEAREVVEYAAKLGITVVPEIDLPGHMLSALACYPYLGCTGGPYQVSAQWGVKDDVLCVGKESTFQFIEDVLTEICDIFPSEYIHIGGDECPKVRWHECPACQARINELGLKDDEKFSKEQYLQNYVTSRVQKFLEGKGRKIIGWEEILEGDLQPGATVMSWTGTKAGIEASARGIDVIMTPAHYCYIDYCQADDAEKEPICLGDYVPVERCYGYNPTQGLTEGAEKYILGLQGNLWGEFVEGKDKVQYMLLPRAIALGEVGWTNDNLKDYDRFKDAVEQHQFKVMDAMGIRYSKVISGINGYWWE